MRLAVAWVCAVGIVASTVFASTSVAVAADGQACRPDSAGRIREASSRRLAPISLSPKGGALLFAEMSHAEDGSPLWRFFIARVGALARSDWIEVSGRGSWRSETQFGVAGEIVDVATGARSQLQVRNPEMLPEHLQGRLLSSGEWSSSGRYFAFRTVLRRPTRLTPAGAAPVEGRDWLLSNLWDPDASAVNALFVFDSLTGQVSRLTDLETRVEEFDWSPDETALAITSRDAADIDRSGFARTNVMRVPINGDPITAISVRAGVDEAHPSWSPDGFAVAYTTSEASDSDSRPHPTHTNARIEVRRVDGLIDIRGQEVSFPSNRTTLSWSIDSTAVVFGVAKFFAKELQYVGANESGPVVGLDGYPLVYSRDLVASEDGAAVAYISETALDPGRLVIATLSESGHKVESEAAIYMNEGVDFSDVDLEIVKWPAPDGTRIEGLLYRPKDRNASQPLPTIMVISGGPQQVENTFARMYGYELYLVSCGYAVFVPATRGRPGFGEAFLFGIRDSGSRHAVPYLDGDSGLDYLVARGIADPNQLGLFGHSYGGGVAAYAATYTDRYKAIVVHEGGLFNLLDSNMAVGSSWIAMTEQFFGIRDPWDQEEQVRLLRESPILNADHIQTPMLLVYGTDGMASQDGRQFYNALLQNHVDAQLLVYGMGHEPGAEIAQDVMRRMGVFYDHNIRSGNVAE